MVVPTSSSTSGRLRSPRLSAQRVPSGLVSGLIQNPAASTMPISSALSPRALSQAGHQGISTPATAKIAA